MNITSQQFSAPPLAIQGKTADLRLPAVNIETSAPPLSDVTIISPVSDLPESNPTYDKPVNPAAIHTIIQEGSAKPIDEANDSKGEEQTKAITEPDNKQNNQDNNEIYSDVELAQISALKTRDIEVNAHERAHAAVGGQHAGSPNYSYKTGPDGVKYAVSGEVSIDTSRVPNDPQATLQKAQQIKAAALAPVEPSGQDRKVAAKADQMASRARSEILSDNNGVEQKQPSSKNEGVTPDHFTGNEKFAMNDKTQKIMSERTTHINDVYNHASQAHPSSTLYLQA